MTSQPVLFLGHTLARLLKAVLQCVAGFPGAGIDIIPSGRDGFIHRALQTVGKCWRNSVGEQPATILNMRLKWVRDWKPTSKAISLMR